MKKLILLFVVGVLFTVCFFSYALHKIYWQKDHNISVHVKETDDIYQLTASYDRNRTGRVQRYIDAQLHQPHVFANTRMNANVTLDDHTSFYIRTAPGRLFIKMDKNTNDREAYFRIKQLGEGLKFKITQD